MRDEPEGSRVQANGSHPMARAPWGHRMPYFFSVDRKHWEGGATEKSPCPVYFREGCGSWKKIAQVRDGDLLRVNREMCESHALETDPRQTHVKLVEVTYRARGRLGFRHNLFLFAFCCCYKILIKATWGGKDLFQPAAYHPL